ncbi:vasopressin V2 receptor [Salminus brasiliensis]|uniref:vasopressin V2 receptor n=1 Tax=Salminus brasiliensis TaxID=930266 RepID=UPI003B8388B3
METISGEPEWDGSAHATVHWINFTSALLSERGGLNGSHGGGSYFWLFHNSSSSTTQLPPPARVRDMALARAEVGVLGLILALATLGNSFVLWVLLRRRKYNAPMHLFMVNLCIADLVVAFFQVLPQLVWDITERFQGPDALCRSVKYMQIVGMFASSYMIVAMTVDRHYAICCPLQAYRGGTVSRWNTPIVVAWGLALVLSVPQVFIFSRSEVAPGEFECWGHFAEPWGLKAYVTWMTLAVFVLPAFIITLCQVRIFREIHDNIYLKSERVVSADFKKNLVFFRFPNLKKQEERVRGRTRAGHMPREARGEFHLKNNNSESLNAYSSQHAPQPDCCSCPCRDDQCGCELTTGYSSPDVLPHSHTHTNHPNSAHLQDCSLSQKPFTETGPACYQTSLAYSDSLESPAEVSNPVHYPSIIPPTRSLPLPPPGVSRAMSKTVRMTLVIVLVYTMCWSPYFIVQLWAAWDPNPPVQGVAFTILMLLASLNSCTNPWIYTAFSSSVSHELLSLLHCRPRPTHPGSNLEDSSAIHTTTTTKDNTY